VRDVLILAIHLLVTLAKLLRPGGVRAIAGLTPAQFAGALSPAPAALDHYGGQQHCRGLFELPIAA
jgi:hypothetical protein